MFFNDFVEVDDDVVCIIFCINSCCSPTPCFKRVTTDKKVYITVSVVLSIVNMLINFNTFSTCSKKYLFVL